MLLPLSPTLVRSDQEGRKRQSSVSEEVSWFCRRSCWRAVERSTWAHKFGRISVATPNFVLVDELVSTRVSMRRPKNCTGSRSELMRVVATPPPTAKLPDESAFTPVEHRTFCPYKGLCSYYNIGEAHLAAWSYREAYAEVARINNFVSFEPDMISVQLDGVQLHLASGQTVIPHGPDRELDVPAGMDRKA